MLRPVRTVPLVLMLFTIFSQFASASIITVPPGLQAGDRYMLVFVTSGATDAINSDIDYYNTFVQQQAEINPALAALNTTWRAIVSTPTVDGFDNTFDNIGTFNPFLPLPIFNGAGQVVVTNPWRLWPFGTTPPLLSPISYDQHGTLLETEVWTGTNSTGRASDGSLGSGGFPRGIITMGRSDALNQEWVRWAGAHESELKSIYAISGVLTVPSVVPEPGSALVFALGSCLCTLVRLPRREKW